MLDHDLYLQEKIYDEFLEKISNKAKNIKIGDPMKRNTQMGPLATINQLKNIQEKIDETIKQGGKIITGGERAKRIY